MRSAVLAFSALGVLALGACSISDITGNSGGMSQNAAEAFTKQIGEAFAHGMSGASAVSRPSAAAGARSDAPAGTAVNVQMTHRTNCTVGGNIQVSGNLTGNIDDSGTGVLFLQVTETISDWKCVGDYVINGDPYVSATGTMPFMNGAQSSAATFSFGGGFKWGTKSSESCQMNLSLLLRTDGTALMTGTVCGYSVNVSVE